MIQWEGDGTLRGAEPRVAQVGKPVYGQCEAGAASSYGCGDGVLSS